MPQKIIPNATVEMCASYCAMEVEFECKSFDIDNTNIECHLHNHTHTEPLVGLQHALGFDHYRTAYERLFNRIPNHVITLQHKRSIPWLSVEECARRCILEMSFKCLGFDYEVNRKTCWLTDKTVHDVGGLTSRTKTDFYERKSHGALSRFINYGYGSLQTVEGVQTHGKIVLGVNLDACAQLCLAETSFQCSSFDYVFDDQSCQLSQYIAANVYGIRTQFDTRRRVMHYELIGESLDYFYPTPYASVYSNNDRTIRNVSPETCARKCLEEREFICRSFDYQIQKGTCLLSHVTGSDAGGLYTPEGVHVHHFEMKPYLDCGGILTEERGTFASPNWPRYYLHHLNCTWSIQVSEFKIIRFELYHLDLGYQTEDTCDPENDILSFTETIQGKQLVTCVHNFQTQLSTLSNTATIRFTTNDDDDAQGFRIFYSSDWPCKVSLTKDNGEFASPRWPNSYLPLSSCEWHITSPNNSNIFLLFSSIELEDHTGSSCRTAYDKINIYDPERSKNLKTLCGNRRRQYSITSPGNSLGVAFTSDSRVQAKGFHASYKFIYHTTTTTSTTTTITTIPATLNSEKSNNGFLYVKDVDRNKTTEFKPETTNNTNASNNNTNSEPHYVVSNVNSTTVNNTDKSINGVRMAMISNNNDDDDGDDDDSVKLTAVFMEPNNDDNSNTDTGDSNDIHGIESDDVGRGSTPKADVNYDIIYTGKDLKTIILGIFVAFVTVLTVMSLAIMLICRYYRRRLPKLRQGSNIQHPDENLSLCHNNRSAQEEYKDEADVDEAARLPSPRDYKPDPDVEFLNPLYHGSCSIFTEANTETTDQSVSNLELDSDVIDDVDTQNVNSSVNDITRHEIRAVVNNQTNNTQINDPYSDSDDEYSPHIDCLTTV
ncbi:hypothetical protein ACF0H5_021315 [Mactra antiquata]